MTNIQPCSKRLFWIDALRLGLALCIAVLHFNWRYLPQAYLGVEVFFILGGLFFVLNYDSSKEDISWDKIKKRLFSVWKWFATAIGMLLILSVRGGCPSFSRLANILLGWSYIGLGPMWGPGAYWFIGVYIYVSIVYILLFRLFSPRQVFPLIALLVLAIVALLYNQSPAHNLNETTLIVFNLSFGFWRGLAAFGLGILLGKLVCYRCIFSSIKFSLCVFFFLIPLVLYIFLKNPPTAHYDYLWYLIAATLVLCCYYLPNPRFCLPKDFLRLPLVIYLFHPVVIYILERKDLHVCLVVYLVLVIIFSLLILKSATKLRAFVGSKKE